MRILRWVDRNLHRYLAAVLLLVGLLYAVIAELPQRVGLAP